MYLSIWAHNLSNKTETWGKSHVTGQDSKSAGSNIFADQIKWKQYKPYFENCNVLRTDSTLVLKHLRNFTYTLDNFAN